MTPGVPPPSPFDTRLLKAFLERQRWFAGKARTLADVRLVDWGPLEPAPARIWLTILEAVYDEGGRERYTAAILTDPGSGAISDALDQDAACRALLAASLSGGSIAMHQGSVRAQSAADAPARALDDLTIRRGSPDQSNTCVIFGGRYILKLIRRLEPGPNVEVEIGARLTAIGFANAAPLAGTLEYVPAQGPSASLAVVQGFVANGGTAWEAALGDAARDLERPTEPGAGYRPSARRLGERTGELHAALARPTPDPDFAPEPFTQADLAERLGLVQQEGDRALALLQSRLGTLAPTLLDQATRVLNRRSDISDTLDSLAHQRVRASRTRVHGDYHLGQVLVTGDDFLIIDFEGEPTRSLAERRAKTSPLKDVAGMLRSFAYAADVALDRAAAADRDNRDIGPIARRWEASAAAAFLAGYHAATAGAEFLPEGDAFDALLAAFLIEKAFYELAYELGSRPDWVHIPLRALVQLLP